MAIVNRTPDSFYDHGLTFHDVQAQDRARQVVDEGADIIDIGGVKAGPGPCVTVEEEIERVIPFVSWVREKFPTIIVSVDTWRAEVARRAIDAGADVINDTWAGYDTDLVAVVGEAGKGIVCSHTGGVTPRTRPFRSSFDDVVHDVVTEVVSAAHRARKLGVPADGILVDPTHDFGKNTYHGLELLRRIDELVSTGYPVLMALSNKDFIGETLDADVMNRVPGTLAATAWSVAHGARVFRSHEVAETRDVVDMIAAIEGRLGPRKAIRGLV